MIDLLFSDMAQAEAVFAGGFSAERCYLDSFLALPEGAKALAARMRQLTEAELFLALPYMTRQEQALPMMRDLERFCEEASDAGFAGMLARNFEQFAFLTEKGYAGELAADRSLYVWNPQAFFALRERNARFKGFTLSPEMSLAQWRHLTAELQGEAQVTAVVYGYLPLMVSAGCIKENEPGGGCSKQRGEAYRCGTELTDRTGRRMQVTCDCRNCYNVIWNAHRLSLHDALAQLAAMGERVRLRLDFTTESAEEAAAVCRVFLAAEKGEELTLPYTEYTTGRLKKGVE
ncbi:MAG: U32 family peptidase [Lachnospiraceae bacterium]|nr:U32 family peptidase [Lachnospiraceae bacterium]